MALLDVLPKLNPGIIYFIFQKNTPAAHAIAVTASGHASGAASFTVLSAAQTAPPVAIIGTAKSNKNGIVFHFATACNTKYPNTAAAPTIKSGA